MDGNGRWAENRGLPRCDGHIAGVGVAKSIVKACVENNVKVLSLWAFSSENWSRPTIEIDFLMQLFVQALTNEIDELHQNGVRLCFTGSRAELSHALSEQMQKAETLTVNNSKLTLNVVINYGGKWDIVQAVKTLTHRVVNGEIPLEDINEKMFTQQLNTCDLPDPDLFIRTGGEQRLSNFFLWQLAYTELYFSDSYWPDFTVQEFKKALGCFSSRERRFGQTSQQIFESNHV